MLSEHAMKRLVEYVKDISPLPNACILLTHLADHGILQSFKVGEEPSWTQIVAACLIANPHITVDEVVHELELRDIPR